MDFLEFLPDLKALSILDFLVEDLRPIHSLHELKYLKTHTYCNSEIDFSAFPQLEKVVLEWRAKAKSIYDCTTLRSIFINCWSGKSLEPFSKLTKLEYLGLAGSRIKRIGDVNFPNLDYLDLRLARGLESLDGIERFKNLARLDVNTCRKISKLDPLAKLPRLNFLYFANNGEIESLSPLRKMKSLEVFHFIESTNIKDGDLSILRELPNLKEVSFQNRRHYNLKRKELPQYR